VIKKADLLSRIESLVDQITGLVKNGDSSTPSLKLPEREVVLICKHGVEIEKTKIFDLNGFIPPWFMKGSKKCEFVGAEFSSPSSTDQPLLPLPQPDSQSSTRPPLAAPSLQIH